MAKSCWNSGVTAKSCCAKSCTYGGTLKNNEKIDRE